MRIDRLPAALILALLIAGCVASHKEEKELNLPIEEVLSRVQLRNGVVKTIRGEGTITIESPEASSSGSFDAFLRKPDSLKVDLRGPFGIHVGTLSLSQDKFLFYNSRENTAIVGKPDSATLKSMFRVDMGLDEVLRTFTGEYRIIHQPDSLLRFYAQDEMYVLAYKLGDKTVEYRIDGEDFVVRTYRELDNHGNATLTILSSRVVESHEIPMPTLLRVIFPRERRSVSIVYDDVNINDSIECSFTPPKGVTYIYR